jgi:excisionase family DNA binding protein
MNRGRGFGLVTDDGVPEELPQEIVDALKMMLGAMCDGASVVLLQEDEVLTTTQAAKLLSVSRPHLVELLDTGVIPGFKSGSHRRGRAADVVAHLERRQRRAAALSAIDEEVEAAGLADRVWDGE